jgi:hypothetical protein
VEITFEEYLKKVNERALDERVKKLKNQVWEKNEINSIYNFLIIIYFKFKIRHFIFY